MPNKNILILCFAFPPFPGIGGRRWAKFAKYLAQNDHNVHVLAAEHCLEEKSEWTSDVKHPKIKLHTFKMGLTLVLTIYPKTFFKKIVYRILSFIRLLVLRGNKDNRLYFVRRQIVKKAERIIEQHKIDTLIVTIPPYKLSYYTLSLKKKFPNLKYIVDFRDPWSENKSFHGFANISEKDLAAEIIYESRVLQTADVVFDVNAHSLEVLKGKTKTKAKFIHMPNGFDTEDYNYLIPKNYESPTKRFVYAGSFYPNLIYLLRPLISALSSIEKTHPDLFKNLRFDFYGDMDHNAIAILKELNCKAIKFHGHLNHQQIVDEVNDADFCMLFSAMDHQDVFNTKFYEYLYFRKPILYFGKKGDTSDFILNNKIGLLFESETLAQRFYDFLISNQLNDFDFNKKLDISAFEIKNRTVELIKIINE